MSEWKRTVWGALTLITCPCHLPIILVIAAGSAGGAWISRYLGPLIGTSVAIFAISLFFMSRQTDEKRQRRPHQHRPRT